MTSRFGEGISRTGEIVVDMGCGIQRHQESADHVGLATATSANHGLRDADATKNLIKDNPELVVELEAKIVEAIKVK